MSKSNKYYLAIDAGKGSLKYSLMDESGKIEYGKIDTNVRPFDEDEDDEDALLKFSSGLNIAEYKNKKYVVGDINAETSENNSKVADDTHTIISLVAIAKLIPNGSTISVIVGVPLGEYINDKAKYISLILPRGDVKIDVNKETHSFNIANIDYLPECLGSVKASFADVIDNNSQVGFIDWGYLNSTCCYYKTGQFQNNLKVFDKNGVGIVLHNICNVCNNELNPVKRFTIADIKLAMLNNMSLEGYEEESKEIFTKEFRKAFKSVIKACNGAGWDITRCQLVFIGGGSQIMKETILENYPNAIIGDEYTNAKSFMKVLCKAYGLVCKEE